MASGGGETDGKYEYMRVLRPALALPFLPPEDATAVYAGLQRTLNNRKKYSIFTFFFFFLFYPTSRGTTLRMTRVRQSAIDMVKIPRNTVVHVRVETRRDRV